MKLLLCAVNSKYIHASLAPWYLKAAAAGGKTETAIEILEANINQTEESVIEKIASFEPDRVAFCCYIWNISMVKNLVRRLSQRLPGTGVLLGGPEVSFNAPEVMAALHTVEHIICGEGEEPFLRLLQWLERSSAESPGHAGTETKGLDQIPGLCYRDPESPGKVRCNPPAEPAGQPPSPYSEEYFQRLQGRIAYLETSRGCPYACEFCLSGRPGNVRFFDLAQAKGEMLRLANSGSRTIKLVDRTFNCQPGRTKEILRFLIAHAGKEIPDGICFHFEVGADLFDQETLDLLKQAPAGLFQMEAGLQSFNPKALEAVRRRTDFRKASHSIAQIMSGGNIHLHLDLIAGLPYEDFASFGRSFDQAFALRPHMLQLGFLKLLHGCGLRRRQEEFGIEFSGEPPYQFIRTHWLSEEEAERLKACEDALERLYNSGRFHTALEYIFSADPGLSPFDFFCRFGADLGSGLGMPLDRYIECFYEYAAAMPGVDPAVLRDRLVCDRLSSDNSGKLPRCLQIHDPRHKEAARALAWLEKKKTAPAGTGKPYGFALLYASGPLKVAVADYQKKDPVTGRFPLRTENWERLLEKAAQLLS
jgi:radical SAM superfamily enzyme YgiQ (UPF0313 family)